MRFPFSRSLVAATFFLFLVCGWAGAQEIRAFWADGFSEGFKSPEQVDTLIRRLQTAHCNAIFAQMRKGGDSYYLSRYEPWAADNPQHFDALAYLIQRAHACYPRIQVHAWINTCAVGKTHGNPHHIVAAHPDWKSLSDMGEDYDNEATKIDPGNPDAADWTFRVYLDVVRHYDVDGIHFDFVRYGSTDGKGRWGYNPVSVARFNARYGRSGQPKWEDPLWKLWRRDQVTALVRKVYAMTQSIKPKVAVSAATITWQDGPHDARGMSAGKFWMEKSPGMNRVFQDWPSWLKEGILDINCQMSYYQEKNHPDWFRHWIEWGKQNQYGRWVVPGCGSWLNSIPESLQQVEAIQKPGRKGKRAAGVLLYSYAGTNAGPDGKEQQSEEFFASLAKPSSYAIRPPFEKTAEFPEMPWKTKQRVGVLKGFALTSDSLNPVEGARVSLSGRAHRVQTTDGTGFYAFVNIPPGEYRVKVEAAGFAKVENQVRVRTLGATSDSENPTPAVCFLMGQSSTPLYQSIDQIDKLPAGSPIRLGPVLVYGGSDVYTESVFVGPPAGSARTGSLRVRSASPLLLPLQAGDVVYLSGILRYEDGERLVDQATMRLVDIDLPRDPGNESVVKQLGTDAPGFQPISRVSGKVVEVRPERFELSSEGSPVEVLLTGRKAPGVETVETKLSAPEAGDNAKVTGITTVTKGSDGRVQVRIRPREQADIIVTPATLADRLLGFAKWCWIPLGALAVPVWRWRKRRVVSPLG